MYVPYYTERNKFYLDGWSCFSVTGKTAVGGGRCWFLIDLSTLQRNSVRPTVCSLQLGQGLKQRQWWRGHARLSSGPMPWASQARCDRYGPYPRLIWWPITLSQAVHDIKLRSRSLFSFVTWQEHTFFLSTDTFGPAMNHNQLCV